MNNNKDSKNKKALEDHIHQELYESRHATRQDMPSWVENKDKVIAFMSGVARIAESENVDPLLVQMILAREDVIITLLKTAADQEKKGKDFEFQKHVAAVKVVLYDRLSND